jgi:plasmid stabilization system protein ParE
MTSIGYLSGLQKIGRARRIQSSIGFLKAPKGLATSRTWGMLAEFLAHIEWVVSALPYIIVYTINTNDEEVTVVAVFHGAQDR